eukprot:2999415-Pleurochrysis_carterae.AAC.3
MSGNSAQYLVGLVMDSLHMCVALRLRTPAFLFARDRVRGVRAACGGVRAPDRRSKGANRFARIERE